MTAGKNFKALVRARMRHTGESYTAARAVLLTERPAEHPDRAEAERRQQQLVSRWFEGVRLRSIPARHKVRAAVLLEVLTHFAPGELLTEPEVNQRLRPVHEDVAYLRRELVGLGYLARSGATYRVARTPPVRSAQQRKELTAWEQVWLPGFLAGPIVEPSTNDGQR